MSMWIKFGWFDDNCELSIQVKCWQIRRQTKAPQAAGAIHTDFERGFICAEVLFVVVIESDFVCYYYDP
jgi:ribosome-binding ATPase YchF (GTP1/OBG family)